MFAELYTYVLTKAYALFEACIRYITHPLFVWRERRCNLKYPPPIEDKDILLRSATYLAKKIRTGELKSEDVIKAYIKRIKDVNVHLNAVVEDRFQEALKEARAVDELVASHKKSVNQMEKETPFLGIPFTVKESCGVKGMSHCIGSIFRKGRRSSEDGYSVKHMRESGAIPIAISNTPEWCLSFETDNLVTGRTLNPYNLSRTPGGSSGGEATLISSAASVVGIGSDFAGSIRIPSLFTGIFGHKPTPGYISIDGHFPICSDPNLRTSLVVGPMCRYSEDLIPMMKAMSGNKVTNLHLDDKIDIDKIRVHYATDAGASLIGMPVDNQLKKAVLKAATYLSETHGTCTKLVQFKELERSMEIGLCLGFALNDLPDLLQDPSNPKKKYNVFIEVFKSIFGWSKFSSQALCFPILEMLYHQMPKKSAAKFVQQAHTLKEKFIETLGTDGVFLYPCYPTPASYHSELYVKMTSSMYSMIFNVLGMPATQVPLGIGKSGLPVGIQVVAAPHQDRLCIAVAKVLEEAFGGWVPPPSTP